jgi:pSer/pThr/pTyr-binding forkhead associated (FHA) protein
MFDNPEGASVCEQCGAELSVEVLSLQLGEVCRSCDSYNDPGVRVCVSCGKALDATTPPLAAAQVAEEPKGPPTVQRSPAGAQPGAAPPQAWMAPPKTGEHSPAPKPAAAPMATTGVMAPAKPAAAPTPTPAAAAPAGGRPPVALPPSALPPGWAATAPKGVAAPRAQKDGVPCPNCQAPNPPTARYCGTCGHGLSPAAAKARGKLILIRGISGEGRQFQLTGTNVTAGRTGAIAFPEDPYISANHASFFFRGDELVIKDEGAGNGIYVRLREAQPLRPGDMFSIGEHLLRYGGVAAVPAIPAARHGSPRTSDRLQVIEEVLEGGGTGRICKRPGPSITIGRVGCDLSFPTDGFISARHAELSLAGETAFLRDLGSANGTFLRVQPRSDRVLKHGDYLLLGRELLRVEIATR